MNDTQGGDAVVLQSAAELPWKPCSPGYFVETDILQSCNMTARELADRLKVSVGEINEIVDGTRNISKEMAQRLSALTGTSAMYWHNLQTQYDLWHLRQSAEDFGIQPLQH